jgi:hypothetical protein
VSELKLFTWDDEVRCDWGCGEINIIAVSVQSARLHLCKEWSVKLDEHGNVIDYDREFTDVRTVMETEPTIRDIEDGIVIICNGSA